MIFFFFLQFLFPTQFLLKKRILQLLFTQVSPDSKSDIFYLKKIPIQNDFLQFLLKKSFFFFSFYNFYLQKLFPNPIFILERDFLFNFL